MPFDAAAEALRLHRLMYTRDSDAQAKALSRYHAAARFADPLVAVSSRDEVASQFNAFEGAFADVRLEVHGAAELPGYRWPSYLPEDIFQDSRFAAVDSTQYYRPHRLLPEIPIRAWTVYQFAPCANGKGGEEFLVVRHEDQWALADTVAAMLPEGARDALHAARTKWGTVFSWLLETLVVRRGTQVHGVKGAGNGAGNGLLVTNGK